MDMEKIAGLIESAIENIVDIEQGDSTPDEAVALQWRAMKALAEATGISNAARIRAPGQLLVRRLVVEECDRLVVRCRRAVGVE